MQQQTRIFLIKMDIFYSCHKTLSQEKFHKHNNNFRDNLTELPDHIYDSFLIHSQNKFAVRFFNFMYLIKTFSTL